MKKDSTIKILLGIIAINLSIISISQLDLIPKSYANNQQTTIKAQEFGIVPINEDGTISVRLENSEVMDVNVHSYKGKDFFEALPVFIMNK
ncbi:MAG: hypothetical protein ACJ0QL_03280 [Parvicellaceae bacterium]|jgi:hypothetical protein